MAFVSDTIELELNRETGEYKHVLEPETTYWPAPSRRKLPRWVEEIGDRTLRDILKEVYAALNADLRIIAAMGVRAALDRTFELAGAEPALTFAGKLTALEERRVIGASEKELLLIMADAGSAASHRGWKPEPAELDSILDATEALLQRIALLGPAAQKIRERLPPRPTKPKP
jgi:hypothetical protein